MPRHRVLIVEDEQDIAGLIKHTLERGGDADAEIVGIGDAALKAVTDRPPDLIILDLNLPVVSGVEVCRILRSRADVPRVPIIMLTARTSEDDRVSGLEQGADDYVTKPFSLRELLGAGPRRAAPRRRPTTADESPTAATPHADFDAVAIAVDGESDPADAARVRAPALSGAEQEPRRLARPAAGAVWGYERLVETRRWTCTSDGSAAS
jgi:DNA-binding response OmpR family regulator